MKPIGLVLAGGAGRRMGRAKGALSLDGRPLAVRAATALAEVCRGVLISIAPGSANPAPGFPAVEDPPPAGRGPLAGIHAGFESSADADLLVLACDYPRVGPELLRGLTERAGEGYDIVMLASRRPERDHPLVALWSRATRDRVRDALQREQLAVRALAAASKHDDKAGIVTRINRGLDTISHFGRGYDCLVRAVAAAFLHDLVFDMNAGDTGTSHFANTSCDIEGAAPADVDVDQ